MSEAVDSVIGNNAVAEKCVRQLHGTDTTLVEDQIREYIERSDNSIAPREQALNSGNQDRPLELLTDQVKPGERVVETENHDWTRELPMRGAEARERALAHVNQERAPELSLPDAQYTSPAAEASNPPTGPMLARMESAPMTKDDKDRFIRSFFEQTLRDGVELRVLEVAIATYKDVANDNNVPADVMERFRAHARVISQGRLPPDAAEFLEEVGYDSSLDDV